MPNLLNTFVLTDSDSSEVMTAALSLRNVPEIESLVEKWRNRKEDHYGNENLLSKKRRIFRRVACIIAKCSRPLIN
jgi:hypothetical protein